MTLKKGRDYQYTIRVADETYLSGDAGSVGIVFANMSGRNFARHPNPRNDHQSWLDYMTRTHPIAISIGMRIELVSPEGAMLERSTVGAFFESSTYAIAEETRTP